VDRRIEREWQSVLCPGGKGRVQVMSEWDVLSEKGRILKRTLRQIDCHDSCLCELGGADCNWKCEEVIGKRER